MCSSSLSSFRFRHNIARRRSGSFHKKSKSRSPSLSKSLAKARGDAGPEVTCNGNSINQSKHKPGQQSNGSAVVGPVGFRGPVNGDEFFEQFGEAPLLTAVLTYLSFLFLNILGRLQDFLRYVGVLKCSIVGEPDETKDFVPLYSSYEAFYTRNLYRRVQDCWNRPICSSPGSEMTLLDRETKDHWWTYEFTGGCTKVLNFGSYNYLGFGCPDGPPREEARSATLCYGTGSASPRQEAGTIALHRELEDLVAEFMSQEAAIVFSMGFATNSLNLPCLVDKHCLVLSDELNHTSLILGCRLSGALIKTFKHNDMADLERLLEEAVIYGRPRMYRPYKKILIVVEGVYSMEGSIVHLPELLELKRKYKAFVYLDEAHSIGAIGRHGSGACDYFGINPSEVDILMGTFTKGFGSAGGYITGNRRLIDYLRSQSHCAVYGASMPAPVTQQVISAMRIIMGRVIPGEGLNRIHQLARNTHYFRARLHAMGLLVYGNRDSPVVPVVICMPAKLTAFSRRCLDLGLGVVVVGFPATQLLLSRVRFCISAAHTWSQLDKAIRIIEQVSDELSINYSAYPMPSWAQRLLDDMGYKPTTAVPAAAADCKQPPVANGKACSHKHRSLTSNGFVRNGYVAKATSTDGNNNINNHNSKSLAVSKKRVGAA